MRFQYNPKLVQKSRELRSNMTRQECHLWYDFLKSLPVTVHRQMVIGNYIVDFYIDSAKTVIEIDGSQHYEHENILKDRIRDEYLKSLGLTVLRYSNHDINCSFSSVCDDIYKNMMGSQYKELPRND